MKLNRASALTAYAFLVVGSVLIAVAVCVEDRGRADWIGGPVVLVSLVASIPIHLLALGAIWFGQSVPWRISGLMIGLGVVALVAYFYAGYTSWW